MCQGGRGECTVSRPSVFSCVSSCVLLLCPAMVGKAGSALEMIFFFPLKKVCGSQCVFRIFPSSSLCLKFRNDEFKNTDLI